MSKLFCIFGVSFVAKDNLSQYSSNVTKNFFISSFKERNFENFKIFPYGAFKKAEYCNCIPLID